MLGYRSIELDVVAEPAPRPIAAVSVLDALANALRSQDLLPSEQRTLALSYHREMLKSGSLFYAASWQRITNSITEKSFPEADSAWCQTLEQDLNAYRDVAATHAAEKLGFSGPITTHGAPILVMSDLDYTAMYLALAHARVEIQFPIGPAAIDEFARIHQFGDNAACHNSDEGIVYFAANYWQNVNGPGPITKEIQVELDITHAHEEIHHQQNASLSAELSTVAPEIHARMSGHTADLIREVPANSRLYVDAHTVPGVEAQAASLEQVVGRELSTARGIAPEIIDRVHTRVEAEKVHALSMLDSRSAQNWTFAVYAAAPAMVRRLAHALGPVLGNLPHELLTVGIRAPELLGQPGEQGLDWLARGLGALNIEVDKEELRKLQHKYLETPTTPLFERQSPVAVLDQFTVPSKHLSAGSVSGPSWLAHNVEEVIETTGQIRPPGRDFPVSVHARRVPNVITARAGFEWPQHPNKTGPLL
ncbi:MAG: hypothetical protein HOQ05_00405 [Corynebacteriales bacterium]|nr:hypothetical protein [Mycobacteriales bacterium]